MSRRIAFVLLATHLTWNVTTVAPAQEPNNTFATATELAVGTLSVTDTLTPGNFVESPDTLLGARNALNMISATDDNSSVFGDGRASQLEFIPTNAGALAFAVTGKGDDAFSGDHVESGEYEVLVAVYDSEGEVIESFFEVEALEPGEVDEFSYFYAEGVDYDVFLDNIVAPGGDVDFFRFTGLTAGESFTAETSDPLGTEIDTLMALFDDEGIIVNENDDIDPAAGNFLSRLTGVVPDSGELVFAVTGLGDAFYDGDHYQAGSYTLTVSLDGGLAADFNGDGEVDRLDLLQWEGDYGPDDASSADADGDSDGADFLVWQREINSPGGATAVPEPGAWALAAFGAALAMGSARALRCRGTSRCG